MTPPVSRGKEAIHSAALRLFTERGVDGTSIRDIAREAGLTNPALYRHYASKEALAEALFDEMYRQLVACMLRAIRARGPASERLARLVRQTLELADENPQGWRFAQDHLGRFFPLVQRVGETPIGQLESLLEDGVARGEFRHGDPTLYGGMIIGLLFQVARLWTLGNLDMAFERVITETSAACLRMVAA